MRAHFLHNGVGNVLAPFLESIPRGSDLYWLTYNLAVPDEVLEILRRRRVRSRFLCCHPRGGPELSASTWKVLAAARSAELRGLREAARFPDGEDGHVGFLHSKVVVWRDPKEQEFGLATGSFNCSQAAWAGNAESVQEFGNGVAARQGWDYAADLWSLGVELTEDDVGRANRVRRREFSDLGAVEGTTYGEAQRRPVAAKAVEPIRDPLCIAEFAKALDECLQNYPEPGGDEQWKIFLELSARAADFRRDLLYLPVGVGKTFIALRWLCDQLSGAEDGYAIYLVPNAWVQTTVCGHIDWVAERAGVSSSSIHDWIRVVRPGEVARLDRYPHGLVADECQNWNPGGGGPGSYTEAFEDCVADCPILGLSATPCRMEAERHNVAHFIESFVGRELDVGESEPFMSMRHAREHGFVCPAIAEQLFDDDTNAQIEELLTYDDGSLVGMGDYSSVTLRHVWDLIADDPFELADRILDALRRHERRRVVVFTPPVNEAADAFVEALADAAPGPVIDFRSRSGLPPRELFDMFADGDAHEEEPHILVTVDRFAEGVSVNDVDALVMLRATLSPRVAVQTLGRGIRTAEGKDYCLVLDGVLFERRLHEFEPGALEGSDGWEREATSAPAAEDEELRAALTSAPVLTALRRELRSEHNRVPYHRKLEGYVDALLDGCPGDGRVFCGEIGQGHSLGVRSSCSCLRARNV